MSLMNIKYWILTNDLLWGIFGILLFIFIYSYSIYLAKRNNHKIVFYVLILVFLSTIFLDLQWTNLLPLIYFLFLILKFIYKKVNIYIRKITSKSNS